MADSYLASCSRKFEIEKLSVEDIEMEDLNFYYANYSRIYNDVITLRKGSSFMYVKLVGCLGDALRR